VAVSSKFIYRKFDFQREFGLPTQYSDVSKL
jgi:hypothetical protein